MSVWQNQDALKEFQEMVKNNDGIRYRIKQLLDNTVYSGKNPATLPLEAYKKAYIMASTNIAVFESTRLGMAVKDTFVRRNADYELIGAMKPIISKYNVRTKR